MNGGQMASPRVTSEPELILLADPAMRRDEKEQEEEGGMGIIGP